MFAKKKGMEFGDYSTGGGKENVCFVAVEKRRFTSLRRGIENET
jgi:hypothetical protein